MTDTMILLLVFELSALLMIGLGVPLARRRVGRNVWYGFRTPTTLGDERIWYEVNAVAGRDMIAVGAVLAVAAALLALVGVPLTAAALINAGLLAAGCLFMVVHGFAVSRKVESELEGG